MVRRAGWAALAMAALLSLLAPRAEAQGRRYRSVIREAVAEFDAGRWAEARALFEEAHGIAPSARTLRGIGMCAFELREYEAAIRILGEALEETRNRLTRRQRTQVADLVQRATMFIGRFRVILEPAGARLRIDDAPAAPNAAGEHVLNLGAHTFEVTAPGYETERRRVEVRGGENMEISLALSATPPPVIVRERRAGVPTGPVALLIGAAGGLLVGAFSIGWTLDRVSELDVCANPPENFRCGNRETLALQRDAAIGTTLAAAILTVGLGAAGGIWWWLTTVEEEGDDEEALRCAPAGPGVACAGRF